MVDFGPQHLAEHAYDEVTNEPVVVPTKSILAGASRLAFRVPATPIPYTFGTLMAWKDLLPSLAPHAIGPATVSAPEPVRHRYRGAVEGRAVTGSGRYVEPPDGTGARPGWQERVVARAARPGRQGARDLDPRPGELDAAEPGSEPARRDVAAAV